MDDLKQKYLGRIADAADENALEEIRLAAVGKKGEVALKMRELGKMTPEERQVAGPALNALKDEINSALSAKKAALEDAALDERLRAEWLDVTLPTRPQRQGSIHPVSQVTEELTAIFAEMGFSVAEGPRIDTDWYNFDALNIPGHHPARAEMDTFYMHRAEGDNRPPHVLRTHTSPVQIRTMEKAGAPLRIICPGGVYRADYDQTHTPMFHQVEGLAIDKDISMANLKWVLEEFFAAFFEIDGIKTRFARLALPLHRAFGRGGHPVFLGRRPTAHRRGRRLDGGSGLRHGAPQGAGRRRYRPGQVAGLCLRHGDRPDCHAEIRHPGPAGLLRQRPALAAALWLCEPGSAEPARWPVPLIQALAPL